MRIQPKVRLAPLLVGLALAAGAAEPALARGIGEESFLPFLDHIVDWIDFGDLTGDRRNLFGFCLIGFAGFFGYLTDLAFAERGFGKVVNGVVGAFGICAALHYAVPYIVQIADPAGKLRFNLALIVAGGGAAVALVLGALIKGFVMRFVHGGLDRLDRPARPKPFEIEPPPESSRIVAAFRKDA